MTKDGESKDSHSFRKIVSFKDCVGCKLFSVPLLYMSGMYIGMKNYWNYRNYMEQVMGNNKIKAKPPHFLEKLGMFVIPVICFVGGTINLYKAIELLKKYQQEREMWRVLSQEGLFEGRSEEEKSSIFEGVKEILQREDFQKEDLTKYILE